MAEWLLNKKPKPRPIHEPIIIPKWTGCFTRKEKRNKEDI